MNSSKFRDWSQETEFQTRPIAWFTYGLTMVYPSSDVPWIFSGRFRAEMEFLDMPPCHVFPVLIPMTWDTAELMDESWWYLEVSWVIGGIPLWKSSIYRWIFHEINHPASWGYPHDGPTPSLWICQVQFSSEPWSVAALALPTWWLLKSHELVDDEQL